MQPSSREVHQRKVLAVIWHVIMFDSIFSSETQWTSIILIKVENNILIDSVIMYC